VLLPVRVVSWNPRTVQVHERVRIGRRLDNFGDVLGPVIVDRMLEVAGIRRSESGRKKKRLLAVGSILSMARDGDTVWGIGANGKTLNKHQRFRTLDVRAVRGPLTREFLLAKGIPVPEIYGDPALLIGKLWDRDQLAAGAPHREVTVIPNFHDFETAESSANLVNPRWPVWKVISAIAASDYVVGSSLHAIVVAESLGIPARLVDSQIEPPFKYRDYYEGTGRLRYESAATAKDAIEMGGEPLPDWDPQPLMDAFPYDLWRDPA